MMVYAAKSTPERLAVMMVGRPVLLRVAEGRRKRGEAVLRVEGLTVIGDRRTTAAEDLSLQVHAGEIVGVAGVAGKGQTELMEALAVLLVSAGLDEVLSLADRIAVIYKGRIAGMIDAADADSGRLGLLIAGAGEPHV